VLMYCATHQTRPNAPTIGEIIEAHGLSKSHVTKIVMTLSAAGYLSTTRGRGGGLRLMRSPDQINLGDVIRQTEPHFNLVECFDSITNQCVITGNCKLKGVLMQARQKFLFELDQIWLSDLVRPPSATKIRMPPPTRARVSP
jgi:Rrf2 family nitric oxide-sensitive transcriptional repressor